MKRLSSLRLTRDQFATSDSALSSLKSRRVSGISFRGLASVFVASTVLFSLWAWFRSVEHGVVRRDQSTADDWLSRVDVDIEGATVNPHPYIYLINQDRVCGSATIVLVVGVASAPSHFDRRVAIRESWARVDLQKRVRARVLFFLGRPDDPSIQEQVELESSIYGDVIQEDFDDSYVNLTLKSVMALKWVALFCPRAQHFLKTDDDVFVNLPRLVEFVSNEGREKWIVGCIKQKKSPRPIAQSGGSIPHSFGHPPFVAGAGYVISGDLIVPLFRASLRTTYLPVEDVYITAHCALSLGVHPQHKEGFTCGETLMDDCQMTSLFTAHHVTPDKQRYLWNVLHDENSPCHA